MPRGSRLPVYKPRTFLSPGYQDNLGWGFATALGAQDARRDVPVLSISGDGGFMFTANEMATAVRHRIPLTAIVFADGAFGNVRRIQQERFGNRLIASDLANPDFVRFAESFGAAGERARTPEELRAALKRAFARRDGPTLIEVPVGPLPSPWQFIFMPRVRGADGISLDVQAIRDSRYVARMDLITTTNELAAACERLARHPFVTVDTEFLRETTYYPLLCVAQMASPDEAVVIDALAPGIDLKPFFKLMADERVLKVFHAARQDIEIVWHRAGIIPHPLFDTQVAAMVLGHGDSISYDQLVQRITGDTLDKSHRFTDWTRRPLSPAQLTYAVSDVTHLRDVYLPLRRRPRPARPRRLDGRRDGGPDLARHLSRRARTRLDAAEDPGAQAQGARRADRGRGLARARGADPRRAALARAQGRHHRRHRRAGADHARAAGGAALAAQGLRALEMGRRHPRCGQARARARSARRCRGSIGRSPRRTARPRSSCSRCCCA